MKKTQLKDAFRNIKKRIVSYLSIMLVVGLGLGGLFTTSYMDAGIVKKATKYYEDHKFKDYDMASSYGISEANLAKIKTADKVIDAEGVIQANGVVSFSGQKRNATVISLTENVSVPDVAEGTLPSGRDECMIGEDFAEIEGLKVGDRIRISITGVTSVKSKLSDSMNMDMETADSGEASGAQEETEAKTDKKPESPLYSKEFTITGLMHHPDYLRRMAVNTVSLPLSAYDPDVTEGLFTHAFVRIEQPEKAGMFTNKYFDETEETRKALEALSEELAQDRTKEVKDQANRNIDEKWAEAEKKLADAQAQIDSGEAELNSKLAEGRNKLNSAQKRLDKEVAKYTKLLKNGEMTIAEYEKKLADGKRELEQKKAQLAAMEELLKQAREKFENSVRDIEPALEEAEYLIQHYDDAEKPAYYYEAEKLLARFIADHGEAVKTLCDIARDPATMDLARTVDGYLGNRDLEDAVLLLQQINASEIIEMAQSVLDGTGHFTGEMLEKIRSLLQAIRMIRGQLDLAQQKIDEGKAQIAEYEKMIADGEALLNARKKELRDGKAKFASKKKEAEAKIRAGWALYYSEKAKYESKLAEAIELLAVNREAAEKKLAEARAEVDNIEPCSYIVLDRNGNAGYVDIKTNIDAVDKMGVVFGFLFTVITAIVCFSTLVIIIDEQKTLVGTSKAFGFYRREVLGKYLVFGVSSAIVGSILACIGAYALSSLVQAKYADAGLYTLDVAKSIITPVPTISFSLLIIAVTVAATVIACSDILRSPASMLMNGVVLRKEKKNKKKKKRASNKGSLYSRLIIRNMIQDRARVIVTIAIIGFSCMLIGIGISMKLAYDGMMEREENIVRRYDIRMDMNEDVTDEEEEALVRVLEKNNTDFMPATVETTLYKWNGRHDGVNLICANPERLKDFYGITDIRGEDIPLPEEGILIQKRMHESYGMNKGNSLPVLDGSLREHEAEIKGTFVNYVGRTIAMSPAAYEKLFGKVNTANCYFVKMNGADTAKVEEELLAASDNISFAARNEFRIKFEAGTKLYNILVLITTGIAILISFMILTNLANIYLNRKKRELTVMRVNGFTIREAKGYLSKESLFTTTAGLLLGLTAGAILTPMIIRSVQQPDAEFVKSFQITAWALAVGLEALFSLIINKLVYRKVRDLNLKDIA